LIPHGYDWDIPKDIAHLVRKMRVHDEELYQHSIFVGRLSWKFSVHLGFSIREQRLIERAALLHDIGKLGIAIAILQKPATLDEQERAAMRTHPALGYSILERAGIGNGVVLDVVQNHHERLDGSGYPTGLSGSEVSEVVRLITLCDVFAAMTEPRSYAESFTWKAALDRMAGKRTRLDPVLLDHFAAMIRADQTRPFDQSDEPCCSSISSQE
jgi:putative nucleotidyltransferase with HDIG domain